MVVTMIQMITQRPYMGMTNKHNLGVDNEADTDSSREPDNNHVESFRLPTSTVTRSSSVKCDCGDMNR